MAKRPRKKKVQQIRKIWEMPIEEIQRELDHLRQHYPDSSHILSRERELKRRENNEPIPEIPNET